MSDDLLPVKPTSPLGHAWPARLAVLAVCALGVGLALPRAAAAAPPPTPAVSAMNGWSLHGLTPAALSSQLALMQSEGVARLRVDASWGSIEPQAPGPAGPVYQWSAEDAEVAALAAARIEWLPIIDYSAPWAATTPGDWRSPPADDAQFAAFAAAIAARYGPGGAFWRQNPQLPYEPVQTFEIWNEENADYFWDTGPDPAAYARLYLTARAAIDAVDPGAQVMVGGLTNPRQGMSALQFIDEMFADVPALAGHVDAVGLHPYAADAQGVVANVVAARDLLDSLGQSATVIDVTEFGWQVGATAAAEQQRADMMSAVALQLANSDCGIGLIAPYDWMDPSYITGGDWGLAGDTGVRPAGTAWFSGLAAAAQAPPTAPCPPPASTSGSAVAGSGSSSSSSVLTPGSPVIPASGSGAGTPSASRNAASSRSRARTAARRRRAAAARRRSRRRHRPAAVWRGHRPASVRRRHRPTAVRRRHRPASVRRGHRPARRRRHHGLRHPPPARRRTGA